MAALHKKNDTKISPLGIVQPPPIHIELPAFQGSLAMLFQCVRDAKLDLMEVPLAPICEAYFSYLVNDEHTDLDSAAAALMALAFLIERKSWLLLPTNEPEPEEPPLELLPPTTHEYRLVIETLRTFQEQREKFYFRTGEANPVPYEVPIDLENVSIVDLALTLESLLQKATLSEPQILQKPRISLADHMIAVMRSLGQDFRTLEELLPFAFTRELVVYTFLALLELLRIGQARVRLIEKGVGFARI